jgi:hypothetical protein
MAPPAGNQASDLVVCRPMTTTQRLLSTVAAVILVAGCAATGAPPSGPSTPPTGGSSSAAVDLPTSEPQGGSSGSSGSGIVDPARSPDPALPADPGTGQAQLVRPRPGQKDPHPVAPTKLEASVDGHHVLVKVSWYGGVEPCSVLDSVKVERTGSDIAITPFEGIGDPGAICIEIAILKATIVDLGDLDVGAYRIVAPSADIAPLEITIS